MADRIQKITGPRGTAYLVRVEYPRDPVTGKRKQRSASFKTKKAAEVRLAEWLVEIERGTAVDTTGLTVSELAALWLDTVRATNPKPRTVSEYGRIIEKDILPHIGATPVQKITPSSIDRLYAALRADDASDDKVHRTHQRLRQMFAYATKRRIIYANPLLLVDAPTVRRAAPIILTMPQIQTFLTHAANDGYNPLWLLIVQTGMRRGEALGVRWQDIDLDKGRLQVRQAVDVLNNRPHITTPKTKAALRTITLFPESVAALRSHKAKQNAARLVGGEAWQHLDLVFATRTGGPLDPYNVLYNLTDIQRAASGLRKRGRNRNRAAYLDTDSSTVPMDDRLPRFDIHDLRHTHATHLLQAGWNIAAVSRRLGHANPAITLSIYAHALTDTHGEDPQTPAAFAFTAAS